MRVWKDVKAELLQDPEVKKEYDRLAPRYAVISELIAARTQKGITQKNLAKKTGPPNRRLPGLKRGM